MAKAPAHPCSGVGDGVRSCLKFTAFDFSADQIAPAVVGGGLAWEPVGETFAVLVKHVLFLMSAPIISGGDSLQAYVLLMLFFHKG